MEPEIREFWEKHPCGAELVGDLTERSRAAYLNFYDRYDEFRYKKEPHILTNLDRIGWKDKKVLEIGLGQGADAEQIVRRGGDYSGVDLTAESVNRVTMRFMLKELPFDRIEQASANELPFEDDTFDIVFSHGVLHHIPDIGRAEAEIARVLKPHGRLYAMLYSKWSMNYLISISVVRRLGLAALYLLGIKPGGIYDRHLENARRKGLVEYLRMKNFINVSTDGPFNPYSKVYGLHEIRHDFPSFRLLSSRKAFMHAPPLPVGRIPLAGMLGWHLWAELEPKK